MDTEKLIIETWLWCCSSTDPAAHCASVSELTLMCLHQDVCGTLNLVKDGEHWFDMTAHFSLSLFVLFVTSEILETPKSTKLVSQTTDNTAARQRNSSPAGSQEQIRLHTPGLTNGSAQTHIPAHTRTHTHRHTQTHKLCVISSTCSFAHLFLVCSGLSDTSFAQ